MPYSSAVNPVTLPPGRARLATNPEPTGSVTWTNTIGSGRLQQRCHYARAVGNDKLGRKRNHLVNVLASALDTLGTQAIVDAQVRAYGPAQCLQSLQQCREASLPFR